ncbi:MAG: class I SAM-dependent methyltransferase [Xanthomonadaceae bacterium]|nr:class I SAM-dependent methyltransferase [Xanthomonadaceae bacterium]
MTSCVFRSGITLALVLGTAFAAAPVRAADIYDAAVARFGRSAADLKRDITDRPATVLRFAGIKPGMRVLDFLGYEGYYSQLLGYVVGPTGHVVLLNNKAYDDFAGGKWQVRIAGLPNVEHRTINFTNMGLKPDSLDAVVMVKVYHELYWVDPQDGWPKVNVARVLDQLQRALKPGGVLLVVDHSAKPGTGNKDAGTLHRIDETYARKDFEAHGFQFVKASDALRNPADKRDTISYKPPALGHTDRFMLLFRKPAP